MNKILKIAIFIFFRLLAHVICRTLPLWDAACGRYFLGKIKCVGARCTFEGGGILYEPQNISLGSDIFIGRNFFIRAAGGVEIGSYTHISRNVTIHTANHNANGETLPYDKKNIVSPIIIGRFVWIGMNVNILPGVKIGDGAIIGMGTTIAKNVANGEIVVGAGQRVVGNRDADHTAQLVSAGRFLLNS